MKRSLFVLLALLALCALCLGSCTTTDEDSSLPFHGSDSADTPVLSEGGGESSSDAPSGDAASEGAASEDVTSASTENNSGIEVKYCSYSEKPWFALVGTCSQGAIVTAETGDGKIESVSWNGWFSLRLKCSEGSVNVALSQKVGNESSESYTYKATPRTPSSDMWGVVTGGNFQFFFQKMLPDFKCTNVPAASTLSGLTSRLSQRIDALKTTSPGTEIIYMIVPSSMTIYPELVPDDYAQGSGQSRLDAVLNAINASGATAIDLRPAFTAHKNDEMPLYYKLDSHWSDYGAYIAYCELFDRISVRFPSASPRSVSEFNWNAGFYESGDMTYYLQMSQTEVKEYAFYRTLGFDAPNSVTATPRYRSSTMLCYSDSVTYANRIVTNRSELPSCMVLRDSYSTQIYDILAERMDTTDYKGMWDYGWYAADIASQQPDYIIYLVAEWNIDSLLYS